MSVDLGKISTSHVANSQVIHLRVKNVGHRKKMRKCSGKYRHLKEVLWVVINNNLNISSF